MIRARHPRAGPSARHVAAGGRVFPLDVARHPRARRYVLRVTPDGRLRLTVPRGASIGGGLRFAEQQRDWIEAEWRRLVVRRAPWTVGTRVWYRGVRVAIGVEQGAVTLGDLRVPVAEGIRDVRPIVERRLRDVAALELPRLLHALAAERSLAPATVTVRNQRSRWGSCSTHGSIALNWRLVQMPADVAAYVILHELVHLRHPNHSARFWQDVASLCPEWRDAERWLRRHGKDLL